MTLSGGSILLDASFFEIMIECLTGAHDQVMFQGCVTKHMPRAGVEVK
jgi:hypothetical protein